MWFIIPAKDGQNPRLCYTNACFGAMLSNSIMVATGLGSPYRGTLEDTIVYLS